jgi:hypothetical protein
MIQPETVSTYWKGGPNGLLFLYCTMRFIQLNFDDGRVVVFNIQTVSIVEGENHNSKITFLAGEHDPIDFACDIDEFCNKVFSPDDTEVHLSGDEVELIEIDEDEPPRPLREQDFERLED